MDGAPLDRPEFERWMEESDRALAGARREGQAGAHNEIVARRRGERDRMIDVARAYVDRLSSRLPVVAAAVVGSVARGDFNVWSDIDVVVVCDDLPARIPERMAALVREHTKGVQPVGFTREEFTRALRKRNPLVTSVTTEGVILLGEDFLRGVEADG